jgi:hypothetical protein
MIDAHTERRRLLRRRNHCNSAVHTCCGTETCGCSVCAEARRQHELQKAEFARSLIAEGRAHTDEMTTLNQEFMGAMFGGPAPDLFLDEIRAAITADPGLIAEIRQLIATRAPAEASA